MRQYPGFLNNLQQQFESLSPEALARIGRHGGLDIQDVISLILKPRDHTVDLPENPGEEEVIKHKQIAISDGTTGLQLICKGEVALCILAGGAGTRIGGPKCLLKISDKDTLLSQKLRQSADVKNIWILVSPELKETVVDYLNTNNLMRDGIKVVEQYEFVRLTPDNQIFFDENNQPSFYPCGHGDVIEVLNKQGLVRDFHEAGGKHVMVVNVDNVLAALNSFILGYHHNSNSPVTCEVVRRNKDDRGGFLCKHLGVNQVVESFRMSPETNLEQFEWLNTNTMIFRTDLQLDIIKWSWYRVQKHINNKLVIQYERLLQQITEAFKTQFIEVKREERFFPIKSASDLVNIK